MFKCGNMTLNDIIGSWLLAQNLLFGRCRVSSAGRPKSKAAVTLAGKLQELYNTVRDYTDSHGRTLSTPYMKLPPKAVSLHLFNCCNDVLLSKMYDIS